MPKKISTMDKVLNVTRETVTLKNMEGDRSEATIAATAFLNLIVVAGIVSIIPNTTGIFSMTPEQLATANIVLGTLFGYFYMAKQKRQSKNPGAK